MSNLCLPRGPEASYPGLSVGRDKMFERPRHAVLVVRWRHDRGGFPHGRGGVAHGDRAARFREHRDVVLAVADGQDGAPRHAAMIGQGVERYPFRCGRRHDLKVARQRADRSGRGEGEGDELPCGRQVRFGTDQEHLVGTARGRHAQIAHDFGPHRRRRRLAARRRVEVFHQPQAADVEADVQPGLPTDGDGRPRIRRREGCLVQRARCGRFVAESAVVGAHRARRAYRGAYLLDRLGWPGADQRDLRPGGLRAAHGPDRARCHNAGRC